MILQSNYDSEGRDKNSKKSMIIDRTLIKPHAFVLLLLLLKNLSINKIVMVADYPMFCSLSLQVNQSISESFVSPSGIVVENENKTDQ